MEMEPLQLKFKDDGSIPNSKLPLLVYKQVFSEEKGDAAFITQHFKERNWDNAWQGDVYDFNHYHSNTHEVLGVFSGHAVIQFGGPEGEAVALERGDAVTIPAGVGHKKVSSSEDFGVVGAYPDGMDYDLLKGEGGERPEADERIQNVPLPELDPVYGRMQGLTFLWQFDAKKNQ